MISKKLKDEIWDYCRMNDITDVNVFIEKMTQQGYNVEKYGTAPMEVTPEIKEVEKIVEVEVIREVEKIVEVEVDKIVEVIKEVPVEVIKEVQVEKEIYITNDETVTKLQEELDQKTKSLQGIIDGMVKEADTSTKIWGLQNEKIIKLEDELNEFKDKIWTLEKQLEEEKKIPKRVKKEITLPESTKRKSSINWVSKDDRDTDNLYDD